jgi:hypothetical protein
MGGGGGTTQSSENKLLYRPICDITKLLQRPDLSAAPAIPANAADTIYIHPLNLMPMRIENNRHT